VRTIGKKIFAASIIHHSVVRRSQRQTYFLFSNGRNTSTARTAMPFRGQEARRNGISRSQGK
jgi:hypothetical protein